MGNYGVNMCKRQYCGGIGQEGKRKRKSEKVRKYVELGVIMPSGKTVHGNASQSKGQLYK